MAEVPGRPDAIDEIIALRRELNKLKTDMSRLNPIKQLTTSERPAAAEAKGAVIFNMTTNRHQGSDGTNWLDL